MGSMIQSLAAFNDPEYSAPRWQTTIIMIVLLLVCGLINSFTFRAVPWLETIAGVLHLILWPVFLGVLLMSDQRKSARDVFFTSTSTSGWKRHRIVPFNLGMLGT